jgi:hypothetical protein
MRSTFLEHISRLVEQGYVDDGSCGLARMRLVQDLTTSDLRTFGPSSHQYYWALRDTPRPVTDPSERQYQSINEPATSFGSVVRRLALLVPRSRYSSSMPTPTEVLLKFKVPRLKAWASVSRGQICKKGRLGRLPSRPRGQSPLVTSLPEARAAMRAANRLSQISLTPQRMDLSSITAAVTTAISAALKPQSPMEKACRTCPN